MFHPHHPPPPPPRPPPHTHPPHTHAPPHTRPHTRPPRPCPHPPPRPPPHPRPCPPPRPPTPTPSPTFKNQNTIKVKVTLGFLINYQQYFTWIRIHIKTYMDPKNRFYTRTRLFFFACLKSAAGAEAALKRWLRFSTLTNKKSAPAQQHC